MAFPYYNLQMPNRGVIIAVGWPGQWAASFDRDTERGLRIVAGQERTNLYLKPGEEIRTPLIAMLFWKGQDSRRAQNIWRHWMWAHNVPDKDGKPLKYMLQACSSHHYAEMFNANEANQKMFIDRYRDKGITLDNWSDETPS
jgi:alpha-galactosidase